MTELEKMERARDYLSKLANGVNPFTNKELPNDTILNDVRVARCFFYTADILSKAIENGGQIQSPGRPQKKAFVLTPEKRAAFRVSESPITISEIANKLNATITDESEKKITTVALTNWLLHKGFLKVVTYGSGKNGRYPTEAGFALGMSAENRQSMRGDFSVVFYNSAAQEFILDHLDAITSGS